MLLAKQSPVIHKSIKRLITYNRDHFVKAKINKAYYTTAFTGNEVIDKEKENE